LPLEKDTELTLLGSDILGWQIVEEFFTATSYRCKKHVETSNTHAVIDSLVMRVDGSFGSSDYQ
jgi:hypothetical protein